MKKDKNSPLIQLREQLSLIIHGEKKGFTPVESSEVTSFLWNLIEDVKAGKYNA